MALKHDMISNIIYLTVESVNVIPPKIHHLLRHYELKIVHEDLIGDESLSLADGLIPYGMCQTSFEQENQLYWQNLCFHAS